MLKINTKKLIMTALLLFTADSFTANPSKLVKSAIAYGILTGVVVTPIALTVYAYKREAIKSGAKKTNSYVSNKIESLGNFLESKNLPGKWLVDGAKFGWKNKIATAATYIALDNYILEALIKKIKIRHDEYISHEKVSYRFPFAATAITLLACKIASVIEKYEAEQAKKVTVIAEVAKAV